MSTKNRSFIVTRFIKSYTNGIAKSMHANNEIRVFSRPKKSTISTAWKDVGKDLTEAMLEYSKEEETSIHGE